MRPLYSASLFTLLLLVVAYFATTQGVVPGVMEGQALLEKGVLGVAALAILVLYKNFFTANKQARKGFDLFSEISYARSQTVHFLARACLLIGFLGTLWPAFMGEALDKEKLSPVLSGISAYLIVMAGLVLLRQSHVHVMGQTEVAEVEEAPARSPRRSRRAPKKEPTL